MFCARLFPLDIMNGNSFRKVVTVNYNGRETFLQEVMKSAILSQILR